MTQFIDVEYLGQSKIGDKNAVSFNWIHFGKKHKQWLAQITGICTKFGFKRQFIKSIEAKVKDQPNLRAFKWEFEYGYIYQYNNFLVDHLSNFVTSGYFIATMQGILPIEKEQVRASLGMPVRNVVLGQLPSFRPNKVKENEKENENYVDDDVPF